MGNRRTFRLEVHAGGEIRHHAVVTDFADVDRVFAIVRSELRELAQRDRCGAVILMLHSNGEGCDHGDAG